SASPRLRSSLCWFRLTYLRFSRLCSLAWPFTSITENGGFGNGISALIWRCARSGNGCDRCRLGNWKVSVCRWGRHRATTCRCRQDHRRSELAALSPGRRRHPRGGVYPSHRATEAEFASATAVVLVREVIRYE